MADPTAFCGTCPLIGISSQYLTHPHTHFPQGTCPGCLKGKLVQKDSDLASCCIQNTSSHPSSLPSSPSPKPSPRHVQKTDNSLNVTAIAIGVTGAVLLLVVLGAMVFYLRKRKRKEKLPPSAEFTNAAVIWHPRVYYETTSVSPTTSTFTPKDIGSFPSSPFEPLRFNMACPPTPVTPAHMP